MIEPSQAPLPLPDIKGLTEQDGRYYVIRREGGKVVRHALTRVDEGIDALNRAHAELPSSNAPKTVEDLLQLFIREGMSDDDDFSDITRKDYHARVECRAIYYNKAGERFEVGLVPFFGKMRVSSVDSGHVAQFLEQGKSIGRKVAANRDRAVLSSAYKWAMRKGYAKFNPCVGVSRNKERPSRRYVETQELTDAYQRSHEAFQILLNAAYLSGLREIDLMDMKRTQIQVDGIMVDESKTGKWRLMKWAPGLAEVVRRAIDYGDRRAARVTKRLPVPRPPPEYVFVNKHAAPWTVSAVCTCMRYCGATFTFRQLRAKAQTDGKDKNVLGHTGQMLQRYTRREELEPVC